MGRARQVAWSPEWSVPAALRAAVLAPGGMELDVNVPGCAALLLVAVGIVVLLLVTAPVRRRRGRRRIDARAEAVAQELATRGHAGERVTDYPAELAQLELGRPRLQPTPDGLLQIGSAERTLLVFDQVVRQGRTGWNQERVGGGGTDGHDVYRHTLVGVRSARLALPGFDLVPNLLANLRPTLEETVDVMRHRDPALHARLGGSRVARWVLRASHPRLSRRQPANVALDLDGHTELATEYHAFGDPDVVPLLLDRRVAALLLEQPGMIASGAGQWLLVSRNVKVAYGHSRSEGPEIDRRLALGLLTPAQTADLVAIALELEDRLGR